MKSLKPRLLTAVVGITLLVGILIAGEFWNPIIGIIVGVASAFMAGEYLNAKNLLKNFWISIPCMLFAFFLCKYFSVNSIWRYILCLEIVNGTLAHCRFQ